MNNKNRPTKQKQQSKNTNPHKIVNMISFFNLNGILLSERK